MTAGNEYYVDRNIYLFGEINREIALDVITAIKAINEYDEMVEENQLNTINEYIGKGMIKPESIQGVEPREPIILEINSGGGHTSAGFSIISAIENSETPVIGYVTGDCMSMATAILASCHYRMSSEYASFMIHDVYTISEGKYNDLVTTMNYVQDIRGIYSKILTKYTDIEESRLDEIVNANADHHFLPEEAREIGLIDAIDTDEIDEQLMLKKLYRFDNENKHEIEQTPDKILADEETKVEKEEEEWFLSRIMNGKSKN